MNLIYANDRRTQIAVTQVQEKPAAPIQHRLAVCGFNRPYVQDSGRQ